MGKVLDAFPAFKASDAQDGTLQKIVGRVVLAGQKPFYAPVSGKSCVYFKTTVKEERLEVSHHRDRNGVMRRNVRNVWYTIAVASQFSNFYLQDGNSKVFVPGDRGSCRIQSKKGTGRSGIWSGPPPPGVQALIQASFASRGQAFWGFGALDGMRTGRYQYHEESFDINEIVAALGVPVAAQDPFTNEPVKIIQPFGQGTLTEEWMEANGWTLLQRKSWESLLKDGGAVLLSDNESQTAGVPIEIIHALPAFMTQVATTTEQFDGMYTNSVQGVTAVAQQPPGAGAGGGPRVAPAPSA